MRRDGRLTARIVLSPATAALCVTTGTNRQARAVRKGYKSKWATSTEKHILGCYGEAGSAEFCGVIWMADTLARPDDGYDLTLCDHSLAEVRARSQGDWVCTLCHTKQPTTGKRYIFTEVWDLVPIEVYLLGWLWGQEIPVRGHWATGDAYDKDCWSIRIRLLHEPEKLPRRKPPKAGQQEFNF